MRDLNIFSNNRISINIDIKNLAWSVALTLLLTNSTGPTTLQTHVEQSTPPRCESLR